MNEKIYPLADEPWGEKRIQIKTLRDTDRIKWLLENGYLPRWISGIEPEFAREAVDWALVNKHCPAYWRPATAEEQAKRDYSPNGQVVDKFGDRDRIDQCILEELRKKKV